MPLIEGQEFAGYRIVRRVGAGGMGEVYLAQHPRLPRRDALKVLPTAMSADDNFRRRFIREADLAASLDHPNVVSVYDRGENDGQLWLTMKYVEGTDASEALRRSPSGLPAADVDHIVGAVADALDHAHAQGLLHRDVKPANILLADRSGSGRRRVLLADFGIARPIQDNAHLTATSLAVGSVAYSSPEQLSDADLDGRADQYSLACTAYQLLSGATPFANSSAAVLIHQHLSVTPPPLTGRRPDLSPQVDRVLGRALSKEPGRRYSSCEQFAAALGAALRACGDAAMQQTRVPTPPTVGVTPPPAPSSIPGVAGSSPRASSPGGYSSQTGASSGPGSSSGPGYASGPGYSPPSGESSQPTYVARPGQQVPPAYPRPPAAPYVTPYAQSAGSNSRATWSMVTGLVSLPTSCFVVGGLLAIAAIYLGVAGLRRSDELPGRLGRGPAITGLVTGAIGITVVIVMIIAIIADVGNG